MNKQKPKEELIRYSLIFLLLLVAINAFAGGYYGLSGAKGIPTEWLQGSPFNNYFIPSLILMIVVGGTAFFSSIMVIGRYSIARISAIICGLIMLTWIITQVIIIGYVSWMQPAVAIAAIIILLVSWRLPKYEH